MLKKLYNLIFNPVIPYVGMKLGDKDWGSDYTQIEVIRVSPDNKQVLYQYNMINNKKISNGGTHSQRWANLLYSYNIEE